MINETVTIGVPQGEGKPEFPWSYDRQKAETAADVQAICRTITEGNEKVKPGDYLIKAFNYGHDLLVRASERSKASKAAQGPEKEIEKTVKMMVASGFSEEAARKMVIEQRKLTDKPV